MNCASSERAENSKGFDCRNMGEVLSKECVKDEPSFTHTTEDTLKEVGAASENESDKEVSVDLDEDISWLLSFNTDELSVNKCKCEGCLRRNESYNSEKKNAKLLLTSWKEFQSYLRNVYINSPPESAQSATIPIEENERLHEIIQVMRLCDPYQLFQKIEDEVKAVVLQSRNYQLNLLKNESNPAAAKDFITGLIEKYVKLLSSAQQLSSAIDLLLGSQFQRFGFTWHLLNKHLYQSLLFTHKDVQEKLPEFRTQMEIFALKDELYHELLYDYMRMEDEMLAVGAAWEKIEPVIEEYKNSKAREVETLNDLQDILKSFFANRLNAVNGNGYVDGNSDFANDDASQYCLNCLTRRGCPCDECTVTHMLSCEGMDSPLTPDSPVSRSRSPIKEKDVDNKGEVSGEEEQSCECHACTVPPPELMDCSVTFNQLSGKNTHGEGFQLYPHIHGTVTDNLYEAENISNLYSNLQTASDSVYPHLYNLHNQANSIANVSQINIPGTVPNRTQLVQPATTNKVQPQAPITAPQERNQLLTTTTAGNQLPNCAPTLPPPPPNTPTKPLPAKAEKVVTPDTQKKPAPAKPVPVTETKLTDAKKVVLPKENDVGLKPAAEKSTPLPNSKPAAPCVKPSLCGDACTLKHSANGMKTPCCGKKSEKRRAAIARLGLARNTNSRSAIRCPPGKENEHTHKPGKGHSCGKLKPHDISKKVANGKMNGQEPDDSSSQDDTCSERSNSVSAQRDSRHCDCCYCEVFGHNGPSVAPVSRNYQEMRERLRIRLNMKKSAKCKAGQGQVGDNKTTPGAANSQGNTANDGKQKVPKEKDLESLLKFIEGKTREECKDPKRLAKRARQKKRKLEEKERMMEEEADRKRLEAMKKQVTISVVNDNNKKGKQNQAQQPNKQQQQQQQQPQQKNTNKQNNNSRNNNSNTNVSSTNQPRNSQTLNLSGLKSLVEKPDPNSGPKMVTIRRVTAPFSAEPTVTITLKGSTPDKDKVLFMLKNGSEAYQPEEKETTKKKRKRKKAKKEPEYYEEEEEEEEPEPYYEEEPEPEKTGKRKRRRNRKKNAEVETPTITTTATSRNNKKESSKTVEVKNSKNSKTSAKSQPEKSKPSVKQNSSQVSNSKAKSVPVLKAQNEKNKELNSKSKKDKSSNDSSSNSKNSVKSTNVTKNSKNNQKQSVSVQKTQPQTKQSKNAKVEESKPVQVKGKEVKTVQKTTGKNSVQSIQKVQPKQEVKQAVLRQQQQQQQQQKQESVKKTKNCQRTMSENDMSSRFSMGGAGGYDRGKVVINTPSYRLSEVLSSIAPSPPPKEEINLENLRLPPGITITKIEGPITKSIRASEQPLHVSKPVPVTPPIVVSTPTLKQSHPPPPGNVIVVDTGRLKEVIKENSPNPLPAQTTSSKRKKKKKNKQNAENTVPTMEVPMTQASKFGLKLPKNNPLMGKSGVTVISADEARKMVPNLENQQATIIKTSDNMVTIRSPAFQQAMNMQAYHNSPSFRPGINGYNNVSLFQNDMNRITDSIGKLKLNPEDKLARQMRNLNIKEGSRASQIFAQAMAAAGQNGTQETTTTTKKKKKKRKSGSKGSDEKEVEPVESVFQPKDIDLENGDIDDDERELEAFKRFCLQSVPSERKNKVKVNLNIKDIVLKKKSSAIGCS